MRNRDGKAEADTNLNIKAAMSGLSHLRFDIEHALHGEDDPKSHIAHLIDENEISGHLTSEKLYTLQALPQIVRLLVAKEAVWGDE